MSSSLQAYPTDRIITVLKLEKKGDGSVISEVVQEVLNLNTDIFYLSNTVPTLLNIRGRIWPLSWILLKNLIL